MRTSGVWPDFTLVNFVDVLTVYPVAEVTKHAVHLVSLLCDEVFLRLMTLLLPNLVL